MGDLHGDYQNTVKILKGTGLVDEDLHWIAGRTHFVQVGDILDKGPSARKIFDLLIRLEKEAEEAGGRVHALIGNHEEMALDGTSFDYRGFVTVDQFLSFLSDATIDRKQTEYVASKAAGLPAGPDPPVVSLTELMDYWKTVMDSDESLRAEYFRNLQRDYGPWLLSHNAIIKINDTIFVHGGMSEPFSEELIQDLNDRLREELRLAMRGVHFNPRIVFVPNSPLWYRDLATGDERTMGPEVDRILGNLGARHMVVGHSPHNYTSVDDMRRFGGRVWAIDTGITDSYGGHLSALIIDHGNFKPWGVKHVSQ